MTEKEWAEIGKQMVRAWYEGKPPSHYLSWETVSGIDMWKGEQLGLGADDIH